MLIADIPQPIIEALSADQPERSVNDLASEILSNKYGLWFEPSGRRGRTWNPESRRLVLKLPEQLWATLKEDATPYSTIRQVAIDAFAEHYKIKLSPGSRTKKGEEDGVQ